MDSGHCSLDGSFTTVKSVFEVFYQSAPLGRFHVKGPRKKVNVEKWIFFDEICKIIRQFDDFGRFLNIFWNFGVFLAQNEKYPKMTVLKKWKLKKNICFFLDSTYSFKYHIHHSYSMQFMILLVSFVVCNVLGHFLPF